MSKKVWIAGRLALASVVTVVGVAAAAAPAVSAQATGVADPPGPGGNPPGPRGGPGAGPAWYAPRLKGEIISIAGTTSFTMSGPDDHDITVEVGDKTSYIGSLTKFSDLHVGDEVAVEGRRSGEGSLEARVIIDADSLPLGIPVGGVVTAVTSSKLTIKMRDGLTMSFALDNGTDYLSRDKAQTTAADVKVGDHVVVVFEQTASGTLTANLILVGGQPPADQPDSGG
jgi:hypothetical protein